jgi:acetoin utilization deacetylase AcuC-like enzyme
MVGSGGGRRGGSRIVAGRIRSTHTPEEGNGDMAKKRGYQAVKLPITKGKVLKLHTSESIATAVKEVKEHLKQTRPYEAIRFRQAFEAVYWQGKKDGAGQVFEAVDSLKARIAHRPPSHLARRSN